MAETETKKQVELIDKGERDRKSAKPEPIGYRTTKDVHIATRSGLISVRAYHPVRDPHVIDHLKLAKIKLEPVYSDD